MTVTTRVPSGCGAAIFGSDPPKNEKKKHAWLDSSVLAKGLNLASHQEWLPLVEASFNVSLLSSSSFIERAQGV